MDPDHREAHARLWTDVVRRAERPYVPPAASLLAFTAWQAATVRWPRRPGNVPWRPIPPTRWRLLLRDTIDAGTPPSMARLPMTPEEVAASYAADR